MPIFRWKREEVIISEKKNLPSLFVSISIFSLTLIIFPFCIIIQPKKNLNFNYQTNRQHGVRPRPRCPSAQQRSHDPTRGLSTRAAHHPGRDEGHSWPREDVFAGLEGEYRRVAGWQEVCLFALFVCLVGCLFVWLFICLVVWLVGWLVVCLFVCVFFSQLSFVFLKFYSSFHATSFPSFVLDALLRFFNVDEKTKHKKVRKNSFLTFPPLCFLFTHPLTHALPRQAKLLLYISWLWKFKSVASRKDGLLMSTMEKAFKVWFGLIFGLSLLSSRSSSPSPSSPSLLLLLLPLPLLLHLVHLFSSS